MEQTIASRPRASAPCLRLSLPATRESLELIRSQVVGFVERQLRERRKTVAMDEVMLALQEACANVVRHAYAHCPEPGRIQVWTEVSDSLLRLGVVDEGPGYCIEKVPEPDLGRPRDGGYGLHLMRETMSKVTYRRSSDGNELILEKVLRDARKGEGS